MQNHSDQSQVIPEIVIEPSKARDTRLLLPQSEKTLDIGYLAIPKLPMKS
jgi:hypothetical protein